MRRKGEEGGGADLAKAEMEKDKYMNLGSHCGASISFVIQIFTYEDIVICASVIEKSSRRCFSSLHFSECVLTRVRPQESGL